MDLALWALNNGRSADELATALGLSEKEAAFVFTDIQAKRSATRYLHARPALVQPVSEVAD
jgi:NAD+ synthase